MTSFKEKREAGRKVQSSSQRVTAGMIVVLVLAITAVAWWWSRSRSAIEPTPEAPRTELASTNVATGAPGTRPQFLKLVGSWLRSDGGYVLEIRSVDNAGVMDVKYFNPAPIHVSKAVAFTDGDATKVYVELRDVNYPGCTYTLIYEPAVDRLAGEYFQAAIQERFEVEFSRKQ